MMRFV